MPVSIISKLLSFTLLSHYVHANGLIYDSLHGVESLRVTHEAVINSIEDYLNAEAKRLERINKILNVFKNEHVQMDNMQHYAGNPMNFFKVVKRLTADLEYLEQIARTPSELPKDPNLIYPTMEDLEGTVLGLQRAQVVYGQNTTDLANGILTGYFNHRREHFIEHNTPATSSDCYIIGRVLHYKQKYRKSIEWLFEALNRFDNSEEDKAFDKMHIIGHIRNSYHELGDFKRAKQWTEELHSMDDYYITNEEETKLLDNYVLRLANETLVHEIDKYNEMYKEDQDPTVTKFFPSLCRGDTSIPEAVKKDLSCYFMHGPHPFLKIAPVKTELLYNEPEILLYHQVLSDNEIESIRSLSEPLLQRATVQDPETGVGVVADYRITKNAWLRDEASETVRKLSRRVSDITGSLDMESSEELQVANYGIGGHYEAHYDFLRQHVRDAVGNRITTVLFYMTDVEQGGATSFVDLGLTVFPEKGAGLVWWDLHRSGEPDYRTRHTACPVLRGTKWICNKWLHQVGQELIRPCTLEFQKNEDYLNK